MRLRDKTVLAILGLALAGCHADVLAGRTAWRMEAMDLQPGLTVHIDAETLRELGASERQLLATVADIAYVTVLIEQAGQPPQSQTILKAALTGGGGSVTFPNLPAVATSVRISAFDANTTLIGSGAQVVNVAAGAPTVINFKVPLDPTYILPIGSISGSIGFVDGPTIVGTPPPGKGTQAGAVVQSLSTPLGPDALGFDKLGNAWIAAFSSDQIYRFDATGQTIDVIKVVPGPTATAARPAAVAFDALGNAWVANYQAGTVTSYGANGKAIATFPVGLYPTALAFDATGSLWVVNYFGDNVTKVNVLTGKLAGVFKTGKSPIAICFGPTGNAYVTCLAAKAVTVLSSNGSPGGSLAVGTEPETAAFDGVGNLWVVNNGSANVTKFDANGALLGTFATGRHPRGLGFDKKGNVWIANGDEGTISRYTLAGVKNGTYTVGKGPRTVQVDKGGNIWVTCFDANIVVKLAP
ncbi:MAG: repeat containing protein [Cyanobacteria bacterium RYN_339]|nr:repeat containing protein [Cyanobacteria bacterium RYN_339]